MRLSTTPLGAHKKTHKQAGGDLCQAQTSLTLIPKGGGIWYPPFWLFLNLEDKVFWQNLSSNFLPYPPGEGGTNIEVIKKFIVEPKLQNMNFKTHENKTKSKRWVL